MLAMHCDVVRPYALFAMQNFLRAKFVICLTFNERGDLITGDSNGTIYVFGDGGNKITNFIKHGHDVRTLFYTFIIFFFTILNA
jgi:microtubule-associated protein-like 1/2